MKKAMSMLTALVLLLTLTACGGGAAKEDANLGKYLGDQVKVGTWGKMSEIYDSGDNYLELKADGKADFCLDGSTQAVTWTADGEKLTLTLEEDGEKMDCKGTVKDCVIALDDFFGMMDVPMTFVKEGVTPPDMGDTSAQ